MMSNKFLYIIAIPVLLSFVSCSSSQKAAVNNKQKDILETIHKVNRYWQQTHPAPGWAFWDEAAYHTGNMAVYELMGDEVYKDYSEKWAEKNLWMGAKSQNKTEWRYDYGETDKYVLFGDWQICFQTYIDLFNMDAQKDSQKIARAREVMEYQMSTPQNDYWWWADGLYMVMPVMTKLYNLTHNKLYLEKLAEYFEYADSLMFDQEEGIYYRDTKYIYPKHKTINGKKDFWSRGNGWVFAALAKVLEDLPADAPDRQLYLDRFKLMAAALKKCQQPGGYWTRSLLEEEQAPGPETSGTAFFTYGMLWGVRNGYLSKTEYQPVANQAWKYLTDIALQPEGKIGYVQPIGERAIPGQVVDKNSTSNFGVGAFLLAAKEMYRSLK